MPTRPRGSRLRWMAGAAATAILLSGCAAGGKESGAAATDATSWHGVEPQPVPERADFTLTDTAGKPFDFRSETAGKPTLLYFGYTNCPDECPTAMADIAAALRTAPADLADDVTVVLVTTDPQRDTPAVLRDWLDRFDEDFIGLVGTQEEVDAAQVAVGITPASRDGAVPTPPSPSDGPPQEPGAAPETAGGPLGYGVDHTNAIFAYSADDVLPVVYPAGVLPADIAADLPALAATTGSG